MIKAGIIGVTGYTGTELLRLLSIHPQVALTHVMTESYAGKNIADIYPHLSKEITLQGEAVACDVLIEDCDIVFISLPHGHAQSFVQELLAAGKKVIDLGPDFRLKSQADYTKWYGNEAPAPALLNQAVYGLPESGKRPQIAATHLVANPGCYATASILAALPALKAGIIEPNSCIFDAKSGVSGAGRGLSLTTHFCEINENLYPYHLTGVHRHVPEIEQELSLVCNAPFSIQFTPHLTPLSRGLLVTAYFNLKQPTKSAAVHALYERAYHDEPFIRLHPLEKSAQLKQVRGANYCDISLHIDERTQRLIVVSAIDNLVKGAAGQAMQNMNIMFNLPETQGFEATCPLYL